MDSLLGCGNFLAIGSFFYAKEIGVMETPGYAKHPRPILVRKIVAKMELWMLNKLMIDCLFIAQVEMLTDQVQVAKGIVKHNPCPATTEQLNVARKRRDGQQSKLEALLIAREIIVAAIPQVHYMQQLRILADFSEH